MILGNKTIVKDEILAKWFTTVGYSASQTIFVYTFNFQTMKSNEK